MDNSFIAEQLNMLSGLMDIHGENSFAAKSIAIAAFTIDKLPEPLDEVEPSKITSIKGIGASVSKKITELIDTGEMEELKELIARTPPGVFEMMNIKGIGPKKINAIWKEIKIDTVEDLLAACNGNKLSACKGFGAKTQQNIIEGIEVFMNRKKAFLFAQVESYAEAMNDKLAIAFKKYSIAPCGDFIRHTLTIEKLEWVTTAPIDEIQKYFSKNNFEVIENEEERIIFKANPENVLLCFYQTEEKKFYDTLFAKNCSEEFLNAWQNKFPFDEVKILSEESIFKIAGVQFIPPFLREKEYIIKVAEGDKLPEVIQAEDIKAIIHCHSVWSDGSNTIEQLAEAAIKKGFEYLVLTDHSKTAYYAKGLTEERIITQHIEIDKLNKEFAPFKIFKSIESDILNDGSLDYADEVLETFDIIIASPHSSLKMNEEKAMSRMIKAIENPYTSIMGHITGRLLLSRKGLPLDLKKIIDACAANDVVLEINANPRRLDIDWSVVHYCMEKNVLISINPDAHSLPEFDNVKYGVYAAQKGGLTKQCNVSSFSLKQFEDFIVSQKNKLR